jgi:hypothetical protein
MKQRTLCIKTNCRDDAVQPLIEGGDPTLCQKHFDFYMGVVAERSELIDAISCVAPGKDENDA